MPPLTGGFWHRCEPAYLASKPSRIGKTEESHCFKTGFRGSDLVFVDIHSGIYTAIIGDVSHLGYYRPPHVWEGACEHLQL